MGSGNDVEIRPPFPIPYSPLPTELHQPRNIQSARAAKDAAKTVAGAFINFAPTFVNRGHDQVLQHFDVAGGFRFNFDREDFFEAVHFDLYDAAPSRRVDAQGL